MTNVFDLVDNLKMLKSVFNFNFLYFVVCPECPDDPICEGSTELTLIFGEDSGACCPKKNCTCIEPTIKNCTLPKVSSTFYVDGCPKHECVCPECNNNVINCTTYLGCKVNGESK